MEPEKQREKAKECRLQFSPFSGPRVNSCPHPWCKALARVSIPKGSLENTGSNQGHYRSTQFTKAHTTEETVTEVKAVSSCCAKSSCDINTST